MVASMQIEYELTNDDLYAFQWRGAFKSKLGRRSSLMSYGVWFLAVLLISILPAISSDGFNIEDVDLRFLVTAFVVVACLNWLLTRWLMHRFINKLLSELKRDKGQLGRHKVLLDENGVVESTTVGETRTSWAGIDRLEQNRDYIFIYTQPHAAHIIPKRAFDNPHEARAFYELAKLSIESKALHS